MLGVYLVNQDIFKWPLDFLGPTVHFGWVPASRHLLPPDHYAANAAAGIHRLICLLHDREDMRVVVEARPCLLRVPDLCVAVSQAIKTLD